ncbi:DMT family transporter [Vibrio penaeicida]|uniref:DMT family transporter n=1 Tax=Vibrio penaeicida TaxID=104609 RepID=UPI002732BF05|nr:DMT family transporter [Vibrio penaeicida]MDP2571910.1 DMT family transporter [Vibrio penaeicida]
MKSWKAELLLLYVAFSWGLGFPLMKLVLDDNDTFTVLWMRFALSALLFLPFVIFDSVKINKQTLLIGSVLGVLLFITFSLFIVGLNYTSSVNTGFLAGLGIIFVPIILAVVHRKLPRLDIWISSLLGLLGLAVISELSIEGIGFGDSLVIAGAVVSSIHIVVIDRFASHHNSTVLTFIQLLVMAILSVCIAGFSDNLLPKNFSIQLVTTVVITASLATALAFWVQTKYQTQTTADRAVLIFSLEPLFAAIFAAFILNEELRLSAMLGGGLIVLATIYPVFHRSLKLNSTDTVPVK